MRKKYADETYLRGVTQYHVVTKELKKQRVSHNRLTRCF